MFPRQYYKRVVVNRTVEPMGAPQGGAFMVLDQGTLVVERTDAAFDAYRLRCFPANNEETEIIVPLSTVRDIRQTNTRSENGTFLDMGTVCFCVDSIRENIPSQEIYECKMNRADSRDLCDKLKHIEHTQREDRHV